MMELPVVATDVGAVREVVDHGRTGFVVPPLDTTALADAILRVASDPEARAAFGNRGRAAAIKLFSADACALAHLEAYEYVLRKHGRAPTAAGTAP